MCGIFMCRSVRLCFVDLCGVCVYMCFRVNMRCVFVDCFLCLCSKCVVFLWDGVCVCVVCEYNLCVVRVCVVFVCECVRLLVCVVFLLCIKWLLCRLCFFVCVFSFSECDFGVFCVFEWGCFCM